MTANAQSRPSGQNDVPEVVVARLPQYVRILTLLLENGTRVVNSQQLGNKLQVTPSQIRKDLSYFGRLGKKGRGYSVRHLLDRLRDILGLNSFWNVAVVGAGRLGKAILSYPGFTPAGFNLVAAFDANLDIIGQEVGELTVLSTHNLEAEIRAQDITIGIVAVPATEAQSVIERLVECGVLAILNYAPISPQVREGIKIRNVDPVLALQSMTYYLVDDGLD